MQTHKRNKSSLADITHPKKAKYIIQAAAHDPEQLAAIENDSQGTAEYTESVQEGIGEDLNDGEKWNDRDGTNTTRNQNHADTEERENGPPNTFHGFRDGDDVNADVESGLDRTTNGKKEKFNDRSDDRSDDESDVPKEEGNTSVIGSDSIDENCKDSDDKDIDPDSSLKPRRGYLRANVDDIPKPGPKKILGPFEEKDAQGSKTKKDAKQRERMTRPGLRLDDSPSPEAKKEENRYVKGSGTRKEDQRGTGLFTSPFFKR